MDMDGDMGEDAMVMMDAPAPVAAAAPAPVAARAAPAAEPETIT